MWLLVEASFLQALGNRNGTLKQLENDLMFKNESVLPEI